MKLNACFIRIACMVNTKCRLSFISVSSLQNACRDLILQIIRKEHVNRLPLPKKMKQFLRYEL